jgi:hypothetical protein
MRKRPAINLVRLFVLGCAFILSDAASPEVMKGETASGDNFIVATSSVAKPTNTDGVWGNMKLIYKNEMKQSQKIYTFPIQAPAIIRKAGLD